MKKLAIIPVIFISILGINSTALYSSVSSGQSAISEQSIPLKEHPRPDFQREQWLNLNGMWNFRFDPQNTGENEKWYNKGESFEKKIINSGSGLCTVNFYPDFNVSNVDFYDD